MFELSRQAITPGFRTVSIVLATADGRPAPDPPVGAAVRRSLDLNLRFGPTTGDPLDLHVYGVRIQYHNVPPEYQATGVPGPIWPANDWAAFERMRPWAENVLPVASLTIDHFPGVPEVPEVPGFPGIPGTPGRSAVPPDPIGDFDCRYDPALRQCTGYDDARDWAADLIDRLVPGGGAWIVILQAEIDRPGRHDGGGHSSPRGNYWINLQEDVTDIGHTLTHEIGHGLALCHPHDASCVYPRRPGALGPYTGLRYYQGVHR